MTTLPFHIVLHEPEIPPNTGTIARLCAATESHLHLIEPLGFRLDDKTLKRAGMDYWEHVTWRNWPNWRAFADAPETDLVRTFFLTTKSERPYTSIAFQPGDRLVFGRETKGLPEPLLTQHEPNCLTIPIKNPHVRSLNLATAVAIVLFEAIRQMR